jgi:hypothetical protein
VGRVEVGAVPVSTGLVVGIPSVLEPVLGPVNGLVGMDELAKLLKLDGTKLPEVGNPEEGVVSDVTGPVVVTPSVVDPVIGRDEAREELE